MDHADVAPAAAEFARLDRAESLRLLATVPVGRLIFTVGALPVVRPMNFALAGELILLRTAPDTTVARKVDQMIVAFEADELDAATLLRGAGRPGVLGAPAAACCPRAGTRGHRATLGGLRAARAIG